MPKPDETQSPIEAEVVEETASITEETVTEKTYPTFTVELDDGELLTLEDRWTKNNLPFGLAFVNQPKVFERVADSIMLQILGEDQIVDLAVGGYDVEASALILKAWAEKRAPGKK